MGHFMELRKMDPGDIEAINNAVKGVRYNEERPYLLAPHEMFTLEDGSAWKHFKSMNLSEDTAVLIAEAHSTIQEVDIIMWPDVIWNERIATWYFFQQVR